MLDWIFEAKHFKLTGYPHLTDDDISRIVTKRKYAGWVLRVTQRMTDGSIIVGVQPGVDREALVLVRNAQMDRLQCWIIQDVQFLLQVCPCSLFDYRPSPPGDEKNQKLLMETCLGNTISDTSSFVSTYAMYINESYLIHLIASRLRHIRKCGGHFAIRSANLRIVDIALVSASSP